MKFPFEKTTDAIRGYQILTMLGASNFVTLLRRNYELAFTAEEVPDILVIGRKAGELYIALPQNILHKEKICGEIMFIDLADKLTTLPEFSAAEAPLNNYQVHVILPHYCKFFPAYTYRCGKFDFILETYQFGVLGKYLRDSCPELIDFNLPKINDFHPRIKLYFSDNSLRGAAAEFINAKENYRILVSKASVEAPPFSNLQKIPGYEILLARADDDQPPNQIGIAYELDFALAKAWSAWLGPQVESGEEEATPAPPRTDFDADREAGQKACPDCKGTDLAFGDLSGDSDRTKVLWQVECENCGKKWSLIYLPSFFSPAVSGQPEAI